MRQARVAALLTAFVASVALVGLAQAGPRVVMHNNFLYKPHEFSVSGDGDFFVHGLRWRSWGGRTAVAYGQAIEPHARPSLHVCG